MNGRFLTLLSAAAMIGAVATPATAQEFPDGVSADMVAQGKEIFAGGGICFSCHGQDGTGTVLAPDLTSGEWLHIDGSYPAIVELILAGVPQPRVHPGMMPPKGGSQISDEEVRAVAAYVWTLSRTGG